MPGKVSSGRSWRPRPARDENVIAAAAEAWHTQTALGHDQHRPPLPMASRGVVRIKNTSGSDRTTGDCLGWNGVEITAATLKDGATMKGALWWDNLILTGRSSIQAGPFDPPAILLEPIADDEIGWAVIDGLAVARLDVNYSGHRFAAMLTGNNYLTSYWCGHEILHKEQIGSGGQWWGIVRLGPFINPVLYGVSNATIATGGNGSVSVYEGSATDAYDSDTNEDIDAYNDIFEASVSIGDRVAMQFAPYTPAGGTGPALGGYCGIIAIEEYDHTHP